MTVFAERTVNVHSQLNRGIALITSNPLQGKSSQSDSYNGILLFCNFSLCFQTRMLIMKNPNLLTPLLPLEQKRLRRTPLPAHHHLRVDGR
jgi:hypothetical protein